MSIINKDLFSYICPSCSGKLLVNDANKTYICESCGNSYDYNYFLSNDTYSKAEKSLLRGEYKSASNMYDFILAKVPNSFIAKVGKVFADNSISGISDYTTNKIGKVPLKRNCSKYKVNLTNEQIRFFDLFEENAELGRRIIERNSKGDLLDPDIKETNAKDREIILKNISEMNEIYKAEIGTN